MVVRSQKNPLITKHDIKPLDTDLEVIGAFNPGVTTYRGRTVLLIRVAERFREKNDGFIRVPFFERGRLEQMVFALSDPEYDFSDPRIIRHIPTGKRFLTSLSTILPAYSLDGEKFEFDYKNRILPHGEYESYGIEDARISKVEDTYLINYSALSNKGILCALRTTKDFENYEYKGNIFCADNKDVAIFEQKIGDYFFAVHRPSTSEFSPPEMWLASSPDLIRWGDHKRIAALGGAGDWDGKRIGVSSVPLKTKYGWFLLYHGCDNSNRYSLGYLLLDSKDPSKVIKRSREPFLIPTAEYEKKGFFNNVVFACGLTLSGEVLNIYYGACDESVCLCKMELRTCLHGW